MPKIIFLYTELAGYFLSCINELLLKSEAEIHIIRWPVNSEAPFHFEFTEKIRVYNRHELDGNKLISLVNEIKPDIIYCSGWVDKGYLKVCRSYRSHVPVIVGFDNQWQGTIKQYLGTLLSFKKIHPYFNYCWVPGKPQFEFALRLGFKSSHILTGFYSANYDWFHSLYTKSREHKLQHYPKRFIYVGRYYDFKGVEEMWKAFIQFDKRLNTDWELWCLGAGSIKPPEHPKIKHFGFVQPSELEPYIRQTGVFILPSRFEPWGVVVHEFAAAGFPLLCSRAVGANSAFLEEGVNGYAFEPNDSLSIEKVLEKITEKNSKELIEMGEISIKKASQITPKKWVESLMSVLKKK